MSGRHFRLFAGLTVFARGAMFLIGAIASAVAGTPAIMRDVRQLKYASKPLTDAQVSALIDMTNLVNLDSSLAARKQLARELHRFQGRMSGRPVDQLSP